MGKPGPHRKGRRSRRRDERRLQDGRVVLPPEGRDGEIPHLVYRGKMLVTTRRWWDAAWQSPMATQWQIPEDVPALTRLFRILDRELRGEASASEIAEARRLENQFGLSPDARRALGWVIADIDELDDDGREDEDAPGDAEEDPRAYLFGAAAGDVVDLDEHRRGAS